MIVPKNICCLDWETFYDPKGGYTLKKITTTAYVRDERFLVHGAAIRTSRMRKAKWYTGEALIQKLTSIDWEHTALLAHHAHFDGLILTHHYGIKPAMYLDTLSMGRGLYRDKLETGASLDALGQVLFGRRKHETYLEAVEGVRNPPPRDLKVLGEGAIIDCDLCWDMYQHMIGEFPEGELEVIHHTVRCFTEPMLRVDAKVAERAHRKVVRQRQAQLRRVWVELGGEGRFTADEREALSTRLRSRTQFPEILRARGVEPPMKVSPSWASKPKEWREANEDKKYTYAFAKNDLQLLELQEHPDPVVRDLIAAKLLVNSSLSVTRPLRLIEHGDPALTIYLHMYGGRTLRHSGGDKMNPQNLSRDGELRQAIVAPKGYVLVIVDSGQIEARKNAWLAGQWDLIEQFQRYDAGDATADPYCIMAARIFGRLISKKDPLERFIGKTCVLGMGYQMSALKYQLQLESGALGQRVALEAAMYQQIVDAYRGSNPHIVQQWWDFDRRIPKMMMPRYVEEYRGCMSFAHQAVELPSGLAMHYPRLRVARPEELGADEEKRAQHRTQYIYRERTKLYGGKLVENVVQALARQVVMEQVMRIADLYRVVLLVHDEVVLCVPKRLAKRALADTVESFKTPPEWCKDLPTMGEGGIHEHYVKM